MVLENNHYFIRKLHSFSGLLPIGVFLMEHFFVNSFSLRGPAAYDGAVAFLQSIPFLPFLELFLIVIPIIFHAFYGLWIVYLAKNNVLDYKYLRNWLFYLQRVTAVVTLIFVLYHTYTLRISNLLFGLEISFDTMTMILSNTWIFAFYVFGLLSTIYHFTNGLTTFLITWGITIGSYSQRIAILFSGIIFIFLSYFGIQTFLAFI
ncbi:MAG: succinate dehydrogenase [Bacillota bacterium]